MTPQASPSSTPAADSQNIRLGLPKGRMWEGIRALFEEAGIRVGHGNREYRVSINLPSYEVKLLKPQNIVQMLHAGTRDVGLAGADWVAEHGLDLVELLDTGLDPVRIVAAAPSALLENGSLPRRHLVVASEYRRLTEEWIKRVDLDASFVRTYGATEVFPPEDADVIVDNTATGSTLVANKLDIVDVVMTSSTRLYASPKALEIPHKREALETLVLILRSVLEARSRVMLELNVPADRLEEVLAHLPCMREPTIAPLHHESGYAVKAAVPRDQLPQLIPELKRRGGSDLIVSSLSQIVP